VFNTLLPTPTISNILKLVWFTGAHPTFLLEFKPDSHIPCRSHAALCRGLERSLSERHIRGMAGERLGMCESNTAAVCKSNGKDKI
jgi:hypothetical protein